MLDNIQIGPFVFHGGKVQSINNLPSRRWRMEFNGKLIAEKVRQSSNAQDALGITSYELLEFFRDERSDFVIRAQEDFGPERVELIDFETGDAVASFMTHSMCQMTPGLINDGSRYWIRTADGKRSRDVTLNEYADIVAENKALPFSWVAGLLSEESISNDPDAWQPPTAAEIRYIVGEGSFMGISGAKAAELVGVTPQNFRKYTARDGAATRQNMSFAMWHLLLQKLGVLRA